jgi:hypothetical protein
VHCFRFKIRRLEDGRIRDKAIRIRVDGDDLFFIDFDCELPGIRTAYTENLDRRAPEGDDIPCSFGSSPSRYFTKDLLISIDGDG